MLSSLCPAALVTATSTIVLQSIGLHISSWFRLIEFQYDLFLLLCGSVWVDCILNRVLGSWVCFKPDLTHLLKILFSASIEGLLLGMTQVCIIPSCSTHQCGGTFSGGWLLYHANSTPTNTQFHPNCL